MTHFIYFHDWLFLKKGNLGVKINYLIVLHFQKEYQYSSAYMPCGVSQLPEVATVPFLPAKMSLSKPRLLKTENGTLKPVM